MVHHFELQIHNTHNQTQNPENRTYNSPFLLNLQSVVLTHEIPHILLNAPRFAIEYMDQVRLLVLTIPH